MRRDGTRFRKKHGITGRRHRIGSGDTRMRVTLRVRIRGGNGGEERERGLVAMVAVLCRRFLAVFYI